MFSFFKGKERNKKSPSINLALTSTLLALQTVGANASSFGEWGDSNTGYTILGFFGAMAVCCLCMCCKSNPRHAEEVDEESALVEQPSGLSP